MKNLEERLGNIRQSLLEGQTAQLQELVAITLGEGMEAQEILNRGLISGMEELGQRFERKEAYVPDLLLAARAMLSVMKILEPKLVKDRAESLRLKVVIGTVQGDIHNIGKKLVAIMLNGIGLEVHDLGIDIPPQHFVDAAKDGAKLVCMSCLLATSLPYLKATVEALRGAGLKDLKTMVGGATVTQAFAQKIGADGYAPNAAAAASKAKELLNIS